MGLLRRGTIVPAATVITVITALQIIIGMLRGSPLYGGALLYPCLTLTAVSFVAYFIAEAKDELAERFDKANQVREANEVAAEVGLLLTLIENSPNPTPGSRMRSVS